MGQAGFAKMHLIVDQAGQQPGPPHVDNRSTPGSDLRADAFDIGSVDQQVTLGDPAFVDHADVGKEVFLHL